MQHLRRMNMQSSGFTLVELMTVIAVFALLAAIALPLIFSSLPTYRLRAAARELVIDFKKAKVEATKRNRSVFVVFTPTAGANTGSYFFCVDRANTGLCENPAAAATNPCSTITNTNDCSLSLPVTLPQGITLTVQDPNNTYGYTNRGLPLDGAGNQIIVAPGAANGVTLSIANRPANYRIALWPNGAVRMDGSAP